MKKILQALLAGMFLTSAAAVLVEGIEIAVVLLVICGISGRAYRLVGEYKEDGDKNAYDRQMKTVYGFTIACALLSFYWPYDMYYNLCLFICLTFHVCINKYVGHKK
jgi:hypothetical protein